MIKEFLKLPVWLQVLLIPLAWFAMLIKILQAIPLLTIGYINRWLVERLE